MSSLSVFVYTWLLTLTNGNGFLNAQKGVCVGFRVFIHLSWWSGTLSKRRNFDVIELLGSFLTNFLFCFCLFILTYLLCPSFTYRFFTFSASFFPSFLATRASRWGCRCGRKGQSAVTENLSGCHAHFHPFQTIPVTIWYTFADCCCYLWSFTHTKKSRYWILESHNNLLFKLFTFMCFCSGTDLDYSTTQTLVSLFRYQM